MEQFRQQPAADHEQAHEQHDRLAQGDGQCPVPGLPGGSGKHRYHRQQQHRNHVLEQQYTDRVLAVGAEDFAQAGQLLADNGRGGQGQAGPEQHCATRLQARHVQGPA
ncbi:hypothetical protein D3C81_1947600 [compost metagenome]